MDLEKNKEALAQSCNKYRNLVKTLEQNKEAHIFVKNENSEKYYIEEYYIPTRTADYRIPWGITDCPLCIIYNNIYKTDNECEGCCIQEDREAPYCDGTPYHRFELVLHSTCKVNENLIETARDELNYLEDLYKRLFGEK